MEPIRIAYQSYTDREQAGTYWDHLQKHLDELVDEGTTVDIIGITRRQPSADFARRRLDDLKPCARAGGDLLSVDGVQYVVHVHIDASRPPSTG